MQLAEHKARHTSIGLTPLIDVVFILLLFFMLATSFNRSGSLSLNIPGSNGIGTSAVDSVLVRVYENDRIDFNGTPVNRHELARLLSPYLEKDVMQEVLLLPADGVSVQGLVDITDVLVTAGVTQVTLAGK